MPSKSKILQTIAGQEGKEPLCDFINHLHMLFSPEVVCELIDRYQINAYGIHATGTLYGIHQLKKFQAEPVGIVTSEKTAIIASVYIPSLIWMACGSNKGFNTARFRPLGGRKVILFPEVNNYCGWKKIAARIGQKMPNVILRVSDMLEKFANERDRAKSSDLADYLIRFDYRIFRTPPASFIALNSNKIESIHQETEVEGFKMSMVRTIDGHYYTLLFDHNGSPVATMPPAVENWREWKPGSIDGKPVFIAN